MGPTLPGFEGQEEDTSVGDTRGVSVCVCMLDAVADALSPLVNAVSAYPLTSAFGLGAAVS